MDERSYLSGYADGEGCFCVTFNRSTRHRFGWDIRPSFSVSQNHDRAEVLEIFRTVFKCGTIRPDRSDKTLKYEVRSVGDLATKVLPHFERFPLLSKKGDDVRKFAEIVRLLHTKQHLTSEGFERVLRLSDRLNADGKKKYVRRQIKV